MIVNFLIEYSKLLGGILESHPYLFISVGLFFGGESILFPALYLGVIGTLNIWYVIIIMLVMTALSDAVWYFLGMGLIKGFSRFSMNPRLQAHVERLSVIFTKQSLRILFFSKFIYGTRIAIQVLSGMHRISFWKYFFVNLGGIFTLVVVYAGLTFVLGTTLATLNYPIFDLRIALALAVVVIILVQVGISSSIRKKWYQ